LLVSLNHLHCSCYKISENIIFKIILKIWVVQRKFNTKFRNTFWVGANLKDCNARFGLTFRIKRVFNHFQKIFEVLFGEKTHKWERITKVCKSIMISLIWRRANHAFDCLVWQLQYKCSSSEFFIVFSCYIIEFTDCISF